MRNIDPTHEKNESWVYGYDRGQCRATLSTHLSMRNNWGLVNTGKRGAECLHHGKKNIKIEHKFV